MSVLQNNGAFQQKRLSKITSDAKQSYEKVVSTPKGHEDPKSKLLRDHFQIQQDRLYAWCVAWTEHVERQHEASKKGGLLNQASNTEHAAEVMHTIKSILDQYGSFQGQIGPNDKAEVKSLKRKAQPVEETRETIDSLLSDLTKCIDTLFVLSNHRHEGAVPQRRDTVAEASMLRQYDDLKKQYPSSDDMPKKLDEQFSSIQRSWSAATPDRHGFEFGNPSVPQNEHVEQFSIESSISQHLLYFDRRALELAPGHQLDLLSPPPYEAAVAPSHTRVVGRLTSTGLSPEQIAAFLPENRSSIPVFVELVPVQSHRRGNTVALPQQRIEVLAHHMEAIGKRAKTTHIGFFRFLGYFIDIEFSQIAFVYQLPLNAVDENSFFAYPALPTTRSLFSLIATATDKSDGSTPNLEDRFRMAYNLILAAMHLQSHNLVHGAINSSNVITLQSDLSSPHGGSQDVNIREPYLTSFAQLSNHISDNTDENFHASIYRHPADSRSSNDRRAWAYDLYSLGLILLEVGVWTPLSHLWKPKYDKAIFMSRIKKVYLPKLSSRCGSAYMQVVQKCLSAPEWYSLELERDLRSPQQQSIARSRSYILDVLQDIGRCCSIDIQGPAFAPDLAYFESLRETKLPPLEPLRQDPPTNQVLHEALPDAPMTPQSLAEDFEASKLVDETPTARPSARKPRTKATVLKKWDGVEIPQEDLDEWNTKLMPRLGKFLQRALGDSLESSSASLMMVGASPETARTTICVQCTSVDVVRVALKQGFRCKKGWGLIVVKGEIRRSKHRRRRKRRPGQPPANSHAPVAEIKRADSFYQHRPQIGASIGAFRDNEHLPPVSFGGTILVNDEPFGMTVHHMLDAPSDDEEEDEDAPTDEESSQGARRSAMPYSDSPVTDAESHWDEYSLPEALYPFEVPDDDDDAVLAHPLAHWEEDGYYQHSFIYDELFPGMEFDLENDSDFDDSMSVGDKVGIDPEDEEELIITQPAIDDVEDDFFPSVEDRDDDHLSSHSLGYVYASSGLRRVKIKGTTHEIDWALIKIADERLNLENIISREGDEIRIDSDVRKQTRIGRTWAAESEEPVHLSSVARSDDLGGREVQCRGRTSGLQGGSISKAMELVRIAGRRSYSSTWFVEGGFGVPGDSGAWVFDPATGQLCGHVLAWSDKFQRAYIAPMEILFEDISRSLGATSISLPSMRLGSEAKDIGQEEQQPSKTALSRSMRASTAPAEGHGIEISLDSLSISGGSDAEQSRSFVKDIPTSFKSKKGMMHLTGSLGGQVV